MTVAPDRPLSQPRVTYSAPGTAFRLPPELVEVQQLARRIVDTELIPLEPEFLRDDPAGRSGYGFVDGTLPGPTWDRLRRISKDSGLWDAALPEQYGGSGLGVLGAFVIAEELGRSVVPLPRPQVLNMLYSGTDEQKERYLLPQVRGEKLGSYCQTEPGAGSDVGAIRTSAVRDGDGWVIDGTKTFISWADEADFYCVMAMTDPEKRTHGGITMFVVDSDTPGISLTPLNLWLSNRPHNFTVHFDGVRVPDSAVLGTVGGGMVLGQQWLAIQDRLTRGSLACGMLSRGLEIATAYARDRVTFGQPLSERQAIQWMLVDVLVDLKTIRALSYECAALADEGRDVRAYAAIAKLVGGGYGHRSMDKIMQVLGGSGEDLGSPIPHWYKVIRHGRIGGGTDEIQRMLISRALFKQGRALWQA
jgi:acyl-CoA dehydrogenase